jgi:hypothetical protein
VKTDKSPHVLLQPPPGQATVYFVEDDTEFESTPKPTTRIGVDGRLVACSCDLANTVCLTDLEVSEQAVHVEMEPDRMGNRSNYRGVAVFQIGFDEKVA